VLIILQILSVLLKSRERDKFPFEVKDYNGLIILIYILHPSAGIPAILPD